jgi:nucleoside-diphosphate-sugar epimerase
MKKILITGSSGFIGSYLVEEALANNYDVYAGIRKNSSTEYLQDTRIKFIELDFSDKDALNNQISESPYFEYIVHNAGLTKALRKSDYYMTNFQYTRDFVDVLIDQNKVPEKFIYMSSLASYGPGDPTTLEPIKISDAQKPVTSYGKSKLEAEKYISALSEFPYVIIRPTAVYGPREQDLLTVFKLINNHVEFLIGRKKQHFTFLYVKDLAKLVCKVLGSEIVNKSYFVSDGNVYDGKLLGRTIKDALGKKAISIRVPVSLARFIAACVEGTQYITGKQHILNLDKINELECVNWQCDIRPVMEDFNFKPEYDLTTGIGETTDWYRKNKWLK